MNRIKKWLLKKNIEYIIVSGDWKHGVRGTIDVSNLKKFTRVEGDYDISSATRFNLLEDAERILEYFLPSLAGYQVIALDTKTHNTFSLETMKMLLED